MTNSASLGRLERVDLRAAWTSEPGDFTPWLAQADNLRLLGEAIQLELELAGQEQPVGPFRADILCKDTSTEEWVLIENQLERTDHTHLGQLLTYAAGLDAVTIIWIAERFTEEHRAAMDWLNERTDDRIKFFGLEIELWRIGNSPIAPKFNVVSQPNDWSRAVRESAAGAVQASEINQLRRRFWTAFREFLELQRSPLKCSKPLARHSMVHAVGRSGICLSSVVSTWNSAANTYANEIRAELVLTGEGSRQVFDALKQRRTQIESALGFPLTWHSSEDTVMCRVYAREDSDFEEELQWPRQFEWLQRRQELMLEHLVPLAKQLKDTSN
jgi:hypothetical protein